MTPSANEFNFERLLTRNERFFAIDALKHYCNGKRVLITGAAGSIGRPLSFRAAEFGCAELSLLDHNDHGLIDVSETIRKSVPDVTLHEIVCDIRDKIGLDQWFQRVQPDLVIHAAALKHVHMAERHCREYVLTNVLGSRNILRASLEAGVKEFVFISTDKAADPQGVMGATKRLVELYLSGFAQDFAPELDAKSVRFGNVLGSQGSVVPKFYAQIATGGRVRVTHPEARRYFMTPREAVDFIFAAASAERRLPAHAPTYVLDMGEPQLIIDLANRMAPDSCGVIEFDFIGLRPGEKLNEVLYDEYEDIAPLSDTGMFAVFPRRTAQSVTDAVLDDLEEYVRLGDDDGLRRKLFAVLAQAFALNASIGV